MLGFQTQYQLFRRNHESYILISWLGSYSTFNFIHIWLSKSLQGGFFFLFFSFPEDVDLINLINGNFITSATELAVEIPHFE